MCSSTTPKEKLEACPHLRGAPGKSLKSANILIPANFGDFTADVADTTVARPEVFSCSGRCVGCRRPDQKPEAGVGRPKQRKRVRQLPDRSMLKNSVGAAETFLGIARRSGRSTTTFACHAIGSTSGSPPLAIRHPRCEEPHSLPPTLSFAMQAGASRIPPFLIPHFAFRISHFLISTF